MGVKLRIKTERQAASYHKGWEPEALPFGSHFTQHLLCCFWNLTGFLWSSLKFTRWSNTGKSLEHLTAMASSYKQCLTMLISFLKVVVKCVTVAYASKKRSQCVQTQCSSMFKHSAAGLWGRIRGTRYLYRQPFFLFFPISGPGRGRRPTPSGKEGIKEHGEERLEPVLLAFLRSNQSAKSN